MENTQRTQLIGMVLITLLVFGWLLYFDQSAPVESGTIPPVADSTSRAQAVVPDSARSVVDSTRRLPVGVTADSLAALLRQAQAGVFAPALNGTEETITVKTDQLTAVLSTRGGTVRSVHLNQFYTYADASKGERKEPLSVVPASPANFSTLQFQVAGKPVSVANLYFTPSGRGTLTPEGKTPLQLVFRADLGSGKALEQVYTFRNGVYDVGYEVRLIDLKRELSGNGYAIVQQLEVPKTEKSYDNMLPEVNLSYLLKEDEDLETLDLSSAGEDTVRQDEPKAVRWVGMKSQFFTSALIAEDKFTKLQAASAVTPSRETIRRLRAQVQVPIAAAGLHDTARFRLYYGPNDYQVFKSYGVGLEDMLSLGWGPIRYITLFMLWVFKFLETFIPNYGLIIFILAVLIRLITLYPTHWAYLSGAKMQVVNKMPEMKELDQQYADDPTTLQQKKMSFYNEVGVNPLGGCIPLLLQLPVLFAMFVFFPHSIELRQQPFLWADDLSTYDSIWDFGFNIPFYGDHVSLFCLLMTATTMVMTYIQQQQQGAAAQQPGMKYLVYIMPIMFLSILNNYSAGLSYYQLVSNILSLVQTQLTKRFIKEEDIQKKIRENFEKRKKEGVTGKKTWMQRQLEAQQQALEEARKKQPPPPNPRRFK